MCRCVGRLSRAIKRSYEPNSRLDLFTEKEMIELLVEAAGENQTAVLLVSLDAR